MYCATYLYCESSLSSLEVSTGGKGVHTTGRYYEYYGD